MKKNILFAFFMFLALYANATEKLYMVIDLSKGPNVTNYPVSYLTDVPADGWLNAYKTNKLILRRIEAGTFTMGEDDDQRPRNGPAHKVTLSQPYYIGVFEVTQRQWELVMGTNPSYFTGDDTLPVEQISWDMIRGGATSFISNLVARANIAFDLPTEAQWEYACRAGTTTKFSYGDIANEDYMWYFDDSEDITLHLDATTHPVGTKLPNQWGLYDMHGNVWEWCLDWYGPYSSATTTDPLGPSSGTNPVRRGGSFTYCADNCYSAYRCADYYDSSFSYRNGGFRIVSKVTNIAIDDDFSEFEKSMTFNGLVNDVDDVMSGIVQIATAKATAKGVKVSGFVMLEDGKKQTVKAVTVPIENGQLNVSTKVGKTDLTLTITDDGFMGMLGEMTVASGDVGEDTGIISGTLKMSYFDAKTGKIKTKSIKLTGIASDGEAIGDLTIKGQATKSFAAEIQE